MKKILSLSGIEKYCFVCSQRRYSSLYKKANELARQGIELGDERSKWLYAATMDRWLVSQGKPQKYGTQFRKNKKGK
jgi:hypothetical protein